MHLSTPHSKLANALLLTLEFGHGSLTSYSQSQVQSVLAYLDEYEFILAPIVFTLLSFFTRMYRIGRSNIVTWDEAQ